MHADLLAAKAFVFDPGGFVCSQPVAEAESADYGAFGFALDGQAVRFRAAKITPTKVGQFVTVWKRSGGGPIRPLTPRTASTSSSSAFATGSTSDSSSSRERSSANGTSCRGTVRAGNGRSAYPPWVTTTNRRARSTQAWQVNYFLQIGEDRPADSARAQALYHPSASVEKRAY